MSDSDSEVPDLVGLDVRPPSEDEEPEPEPSTQRDDSSSAQAAPDAFRSAGNDGREEPPVPLTIVTGWLGAGKTTLLRFVLEQLQNQGQKIAIIQNEASALGVEDALVLQDDSGAFGEILEVGNGCVCCSVRGDFALALEALLRRQKFDYVVLECSGIADPGPLARMFWVDEELESNVYLDGIVSLVDAKNLQGNLAMDRPEAKQVVHQIAYADRIILNKRDLVTAEEVNTLKVRLADINSAATVHVTERSQVRLEDILHIKAFESDDACRVVRGLLPQKQQQQHEQHEQQDDEECCEHAHEHGHRHVHGTKHAGKEHEAHEHAHGDDEQHPHDHSITTCVLERGAHQVVVERELKLWLADLLWDQDGKGAADSQEGEELGPGDSEEEKPKMEIFRMKARLALQGEDKQFFLQGVQQLWDVQEGGAWGEGEARETRVVVIGRYLDKAELERGLSKCCVDAKRE